MPRLPAATTQAPGRHRALFRVLFVCVGNVCRSPLAERLLAARLADPGVEISSAGVAALVGAPMDPESVTELAAHGGSADGFASRQLTDPMLREADLILVATRELRSRVLEDVPGALRRTFTVREFAALVEEVGGCESGRSRAELVAAAAAARSRARLTEPDVPDPFRGGPQAHAEAAHLMAEAVEQIAKALAR